MAQLVARGVRALGLGSAAAATRPDSPIFVVGIPRSGTTLLAAMLGAHSRLSCGPETHCLWRLSSRSVNEMLSDPDWVRHATDYLLAIKFDDLPPVVERYSLSRADLEEYFGNHPPTIESLMGALTESYCRRSGKARWIDKTPRHLLRVGLIRDHFPASPILRIVRDPRDVGLSLTKVAWGAKSLAEAFERCRQYDADSYAFFERDRRSLTVRYEHLVADPERELRQVCEFIGETFEPAMLDTRESARRISDRAWVARAADAVTSDRVEVWRREMDLEHQAMADRLLRETLIRHGYPFSDSPRSVPQN